MKPKVSAFNVFQSRNKAKRGLKSVAKREKTPLKTHQRQGSNKKQKMRAALKKKDSHPEVIKGPLSLKTAREQNKRKSSSALEAQSASSSSSLEVSPDESTRNAIKRFLGKTRAGTSTGRDSSPRAAPMSFNELYTVSKKSVQPVNNMDDLDGDIADEQKGNEDTQKDVITPAVETLDMTCMFDSDLEAHRLFNWLITPITAAKFQKQIWEKKPLFIKRHSANYYNGLFSAEIMDNILREKQVMFGTNLDVTSYVGGKRETHNPCGRAFAPIVWDFYQNGCSVRLLNPQIFSRSIWCLNASLQEYFGSYVGANVYLTPPESQGFAPHYDDIEAFVLQIEGKKKWRLYSPRNTEETLPRYSSDNLQQSDLGNEILNVELVPGDLLYFPRGTIHQAVTSEEYSLHITISASQRNTWGDLLAKLVPRALELACEEDISFRESLPFDYRNFMGIANSDIENNERTEFFEKIDSLMKKLFDYAPVDACVDQFAKGYIHDCLPPFIKKAEKKLMIGGSSARWQNGEIMNCTELDPDTELKLLRANILRVVTEENSVRIYHTAFNSLEYRKEPPHFFEISPEVAPAVEMLLHSYPNFTRIDKFPINKQSDQMEIANLLYEKGLVIVKGPLVSS